MPNDTADTGFAGHAQVFAQPLNTPQFYAALDDAEVLLGYAASNGLLPPTNPGDVVEGIIQAREATQVSARVAIAFWAGYANLSKLVKPVTAASIRACAAASLVKEKIGAIVLVSFIIAFSIFLFMNNQTATETRNLIEQQNAAALKLWDSLQIIKPGASESASQALPSAAGTKNVAVVSDRVFQDTVEFARRNQWLLQSAIKLHYWFNFWWTNYDPLQVTFNAAYGDKDSLGRVDHLLVSPEISTSDEIAKEVINQIKAYQLLRDYAQLLYTNDSIIYGGITTYLLPTIYALLGAFLYGFRLYSRLMRRTTYLRSAAHSARFFIAAIAGLVVGLFGSLLPQSLALSQLAVAFLVGYAVEAFFSWLDDMILKLKKIASDEKNLGVREEAAGD